LEGCLNFKAATNPKVAKVAKKQNRYNGVIMASCARHDIPLAALNVLDGGEKLVYAKRLLEERILPDPNCPEKLVCPIFVEALIIVYHVRYRLHFRQVPKGTN
jgi:hypothetical protein